MVHGLYSTWVPVTNGTPQVSVLGVVLFNILISDLEDETKYTSSVLQMTPH